MSRVSSARFVVYNGLMLSFYQVVRHLRRRTDEAHRAHSGKPEQAGEEGHCRPGHDGRSRKRYNRRTLRE